jgi:hypothetical protein
MAKSPGTVAVKLKHPAGRFKDDSGKYLQPHKLYKLDASSERVVKAIEIGLLEKIPGAQAANADVEDVADTENSPGDSGSDLDKKL